MSSEKVIEDKITDLLMKIDKQKLPKHVAIIMDGNGRWATRKGLPRSFGHKQGVSVLKKILKAAKNLGCEVITVYAFSTENWSRPTKEVDFLINLFSEVLKNEIKEIHEESTKIKFIGDLTPFPKNLKEIIKNQTKQLKQLNVNSVLQDKTKNIINDQKIKDINVRFQKVQDLPPKDLRKLVDSGKKELGDGIVIVFASSEDKVGLGVGVTEKLVDKYDAVKFAKLGSEIIGGKGGGGRKDFAQAGGQDKNKIDEAFEKLKALI